MSIQLKVAVVSNSIYFESYKEALVREIRNKGFEAKGFDYLAYEYDPDVFLVIGVHLYEQFFRFNDYIYCGIQTEQLPTKETGGRVFGADKISSFAKSYKNYDFIFEWSISIYEYYKTKYNNLVYFPFSFFDELDTTSKLPKCAKEKEYDLLFIGDGGGVDGRRAEILNKLDRKYNLYPLKSNLWGDEKAIALQSSKICLNLHFDNSFCSEYPRLGDYFANKKFVLSEKLYNAEPFVDGEDYVSFYEGQLCQTIDYYLDKPNETSDIANNAYEKLSKFPLSKKIDLLLLPLLLEKNSRKKIDYRLSNILFHLTGMDFLKDDSHPLFMFNSNLKRYIKRLANKR